MSLWARNGSLLVRNGTLFDDAECCCVCTVVCVNTLGPGNANCEGDDGDGVSKSCTVVSGKDYYVTLTGGAYGGEYLKLTGAATAEIALPGPWPFAFTAATNTLTLIIRDYGPCGDNHLVTYEVCRRA